MVFRPIFLAAVAVLGAVAVSVPAQTSQNGLPLAPSAAMYPQYNAGTPAGSGKLFTTPNTQSTPAGIVIERPTSSPLPLSLDDAISYGLTRNLRLRYDAANSKIVEGYKLQTVQAFFPTLKASASSAAQELNLAAMGFNPKTIKIPGFTGNIATIVKVNVTQAQLSLSQRLFDLPAFELYKGAKDEYAVVDLNRLNDRGGVVAAVSTAYLQVLADAANITNAQALEASAKTLFDNATAQRQNGTGTSLDQLRGQVSYQQRQQQTIAAKAQRTKDIIQLNRIMGLPAEQALELTDTQPYAELADLDLGRAYDTALLRRKDLLSLEAQVRVAEREQRAVKYERLPTVALNGFYGVLGETTGLYHGVFNVQGSVRFPIFREAAIRGDNEVVSAQLQVLRQREQSLRNDIDVQLRASLLDVQANNQLVQVAQQALQLAQQELSDENDRFAAGVDDNLPAVRAQATVVGAQAQLVQALYQYNQSKLNLARNTGIIESQYRTYLGQ